MFAAINQTLNGAAEPDQDHDNDNENDPNANSKVVLFLLSL